MGPEPENFSKAPRKQSLQSRLQSGMNLQICFMNDVSDNEGLTSEINVQVLYNHLFINKYFLSRY